jgi:hypothetical protein
MDPLVPGERYKAIISPSAAPSLITDLAGNAVSLTLSAFRASVLEEETSVAARYRWQTVARPAALGGSFDREYLGGAAASFTFQGSSATWYTVTGRRQGLAEVYVDGALVQTVNNYSSVPHLHVPRPVTGLAPGMHTLAIKVTGAKGNPAGKGTFVSIDAVRIGDAKLDPRPRLEFAWQPNSAFEDVSANYVRSNLRGADVAFTFRGPGIVWYTVEGPEQGKADVFIDGFFRKTVNNHASTRLVGIPINISGLADALHTLRVVVRGKGHGVPKGGFIAVDRWRVL